MVKTSITPVLNSESRQINPVSPHQNSRPTSCDFDDIEEMDAEAQFTPVNQSHIKIDVEGILKQNQDQRQSMGSRYGMYFEK